MMCTIKMKDGSEYPNVFIEDILMGAIIFEMKFANGRYRRLKDDIESIEIKEYWHMEKLQKFHQYGFSTK